MILLWSPTWPLVEEALAQSQLVCMSSVMQGTFVAHPRTSLNPGPIIYHVVLEKSHNLWEPLFLYGNNNTDVIGYGEKSMICILSIQ